MDLIERVSEFGVHSIPLYREVSETSHWSCANSQIKTAHEWWETIIYSPCARDRGMGKHRVEPWNQEANNISLRPYLHTSPVELTSRTVWKWVCTGL